MTLMGAFYTKLACSDTSLVCRLYSIVSHGNHKRDFGYVALYVRQIFTARLHGAIYNVVLSLSKFRQGHRGVLHKN